jgi:hypothetical protein
MPKLSTSIPKCSCHVRGQSFVNVSGKQIWRGHYGEPTTQQFGAAEFGVRAESHRERITDSAQPRFSCTGCARC